MAKGSAKVYAGWESKTCCRCGGKLTLNGPACLWAYNPQTKQAFSYHLGRCP